MRANSISDHPKITQRWRETKSRPSQKNSKMNESKLNIVPSQNNSKINESRLKYGTNWELEFPWKGNAIIRIPSPIMVNRACTYPRIKFLSQRYSSHLLSTSYTPLLISCLHILFTMQIPLSSPPFPWPFFYDHASSFIHWFIIVCSLLGLFQPCAELQEEHPILPVKMSLPTTISCLVWVQKMQALMMWKELVDGCVCNITLMLMMLPWTKNGQGCLYSWT